MWGVAAVALTYLLGRRIAGRMAGLVAALYMAVNPWLVFYDRKLWPHIQVVFSVLLLYLAWRAVVDDSRRARFGFPVVAALQLLTHVLALVQALSWLAAFLVAPRRWWRRETLWGALLGAALLSPYLVALFRAGLPTQMPAPGDAGALVQPLGDRWRLAWQLMGGNRIFELAGVGAPLTPWDRGLGWVQWLVWAGMLAGFGRVLAWLASPRTRRGGLLLLGWLIAPLLALSFGPFTLYLQYWTALLPLPALLFALGLTWPLALRPGMPSPLLPWLRGGIALVAALVLLLWSGAYVDVLARIDQGAGAATFGRPLREWQEAMRAAEAWAARLDAEDLIAPVVNESPEALGVAEAVRALSPIPRSPHPLSALRRALSPLRQPSSQSLSRHRARGRELDARACRAPVAGGWRPSSASLCPASI
jgi:4-amino-4-deoxy-L-arabinose transferase-like glycosyltransferase